MLFGGMVGVIAGGGAPVIEHGHCFLKAHSMLHQVGCCFAIVPVEPDRLHQREAITITAVEQEILAALGVNVRRSAARGGAVRSASLADFDDEQ